MVKCIMMIIMLWRKKGGMNIFELS